MVEQAIAEGNRVPDEVLRGYPNLAPSKAPAPIVAKAAPDVIPGAPARTPIEEAIERGGGIDDATRQADNLRKQGQNKIERANNILRISEELRAQEAPSFRKLSVKEQTRREDALETLTFRTFEDGRVGSVGLLSPRPAADKIRLLTAEYEKIYKQGQQQLRKADELIETATADAIERGTKAAPDVTPDVWLMTKEEFMQSQIGQGLRRSMNDKRLSSWYEKIIKVNK